MDFLNKSIEQLSDLFRSMTPASRAIAVLLIVTIGVSMAYLFRVQGSTGDEYLFGGEQFNQRELGNMELAVSKAGLKGARIEGLRLLIPRGQKDTYLKAIKEHGGIPESLQNFAGDAIDKDSPWTTRDQRTVAMKNAKERDLSRIIKEIRGYDSADVRYDESDMGGLSRNKVRTALVAVRAKGNRHLDDEEINAIRDAVRGGLTGLKPSNITVLDQNSGLSHLGQESGTGIRGESDFLASKRNWERFYKSKLTERLSPIYRGVSVGVNVELDPELYQDTHSTELKGKPVAVNRQTVEKDTPIQLTVSAGRPGAATEGLGNSPQEVQAKYTSERSTETRVQETFVTSQQQTDTKKAGLVPTQVRASIDVPISYLVKVWRDTNPTAAKDATPTPTDLKPVEVETKRKIESAVTGLLPTMTPADGSPLVTIGFVPDLPSEPLAKPSVAETATTWLAANWQTLGMLVLGLVGMVFLKGMLRATAPEPSAADVASAGAGLDAEGGPKLRVVSPPEDSTEEVKVPRTKRSFKGSGPNLREELADLVKEDPNTAANILRSWIGDVA